MRIQNNWVRIAAERSEFVETFLFVKENSPQHDIEPLGYLFIKIVSWNGFDVYVGSCDLKDEFIDSANEAFGKENVFGAVTCERSSL